MSGSGGIVQGRRDGAHKSIDSVVRGDGKEALAVDAAVSGVATGAMDRNDDEVAVSVISGILGDGNGTDLTVKTAFVNPAGSGDNQIVAAVASKKIRVLSYQLQAGGTVNAIFRSGTTAISMTWEFQAREGAAVTSVAGGWLFETAVNTALNLNLSGAVQAHAQVQYVEV